MALPKLKNRWAVLTLIHLARICMAIHFQSVPPLAPWLARDLALSQSQIGVLIGLFMFPGVILALPGGLLAQRFGDRRVTLAGLALLTVGAVLFAGATSFAGAFAGRLLGGIGLVLLNVISTKMVTDWFSGREIATAMGIMLTAWPMGIALSLSALGSLASLTSWSTAVAATAALSALMLLLIDLLYADPPSAAVPSPDATRRLVQITRGEGILALAVGAIWMLANAGYIVFVGFAPAWLISTGMAAGSAGLLAGLSSWIMIGSVPIGGWLIDRVGRVNLFICTGAVVSAAMILLFSAGDALVLATAGFGVLTGLWASAIMTLPGQVLSPRGRATGFGLFYIVYYAGMASAPPLAGWLQDRSGDPRAALWFAAVLVLLAAAALAPFRALQWRLGRTTP